MQILKIFLDAGQKAIPAFQQNPLLNHLLRTHQVKILPQMMIVLFYEAIVYKLTSTQLQTIVLHPKTMVF